MAEKKMHCGFEAPVKGKTYASKEEADRVLGRGIPAVPKKKPSKKQK